MTRCAPDASLPRDIRHDLSHLHGLAGWDLLNAEDDLVIRCASRVLEQLPKTLQQPALVLRRAPRSEKKRQFPRPRNLPCREAISRRVFLEDDVNPVLRNPGIVRMKRGQFAGECGLSFVT